VWGDEQFFNAPGEAIRISGAHQETLLRVPVAHECIPVLVFLISLFFNAANLLEREK
jgi:hypothetical protein